MKAIAGYLAITCVSVSLVAVTMQGIVPNAGDTVQNSSIKAKIKARNAKLAELEAM